VSRLFSIFATLATTATAIAHEGHAALPTRGATVNLGKGTIVLSRESREALGVEAAEIATKPLPDSTPAYVTLVAPWTKHAFASNRLPGRVTALLASSGKHIRAGEPLAEIESLELENLQEELLRARTERRLAEQVLESLREAASAVRGQSIIDAETTLEQQRNAEIVGRMKWRSLGLSETALDALLADPSKRVRRLTVEAPIDGTVIHVDVPVGRVVDPGEHLFEVVDLSSVWARIGVLERDLERVRIGGRVEIHLTARPKEPFEATIDAVSPALDGPGRTATAWATIRNPSLVDPVWRPGMRGRARLFQPAAADAKVVPTSALIDDGVAQYVLVEEAAAQKQSEYRRKEVTVVRRNTRFVEVRSAGLFPGDRVVTRGAQQLGGFFVPGVLKLTPEAAAAVGLKTAPVERRSLERVLSIDGVVELPPESQAAASARLGGNILRLFAEPGRQVKRGDLLAEVQSAEFQSLQLDLVREDLAARLAERRLESVRSAASAFPRAQAAAIEAAATSARTRRETLRRRLEAVGVLPADVNELLTRQKLIESMPVRAPIDGVVAGFDKTLGQAVRAEEPLFTIYDLSHTLVKGLVAERDVGRLVVGGPARLRFASHPERMAAGRVARSSGVFSAEDQTLAVWIEIDAAEQRTAAPGQLVSIAAVLDEPAATAAIVVPPSAVVREGARTFAFVRKPDGSFERRPVTTGARNDLFVEVLSGLADGETVAIWGAAGLQTAHASVR